MSLINLRKIKLRTICLYSDDSTEPRSLLALSHRDSSKAMVGLVAVCFLAIINNDSIALKVFHIDELMELLVSLMTRDFGRNGH